MAANLDALKAQVAILQHCKKKEAELKELKEQARAAVEAAMGEEEVGTVNGRTVITFKHSKTTRFDQAGFKEAEPEMHALYMKSSATRTFGIKEDVSLTEPAPADPTAPPAAAATK
ncbi:hypothetical protein [Mycolicibacterium sphagni]|uniref:hypothetical protein n=1 Tax=Mycolicibacterium sphagni TaxID=1786 RepID=UPI0021F3A5D2|nr:hypothetical protein [Mycolicibacterium sphagni]MCV7175711.1 hypothetical protein [Mycolicibacterium sphagni]